MSPVIPPQQLNPKDAQPSTLHEQEAVILPNSAKSSSSFTKTLGNKIVLGGAAAAITAIVSVGGLSFASALSNNAVPPNENACIQHYNDYHFKNRGQCVDWWNQHHGGYGYGGSHPTPPPPPPHHYHFPFHFHFSFITHFFHHQHR